MVAPESGSIGRGEPDEVDRHEHACPGGAADRTRAARSCPARPTRSAPCRPSTGAPSSATRLAVALHVELLQVRRQARAAPGRTAAPPASGAPRKSRYQTPSSPSAPAGSSSSGASTEVLVDRRGSRRAARANRRARSRSSATARSPTPSSSARRPSPRTRTCSRDRSRTPRPLRRSSRRPRSARATPPRRRRARRASQPARVVAFVIVSRVVNVFDETMNNVSAGSRSASAVDEIGAVDVRHEAEPRAPVAERAQRVVGHRRAEIAAADPDVHDVADRPPVCPRHAPPRTWSAKRPSGRAPRGPRRRRRPRRPRATRSRGMRSATWSTGRSSVTLTCSPANIASRRSLDAALGGEREQEGDGLGRDPMLREIGGDSRRLERQPLDACVVRREQVAEMEVDDRRMMAGKRLPGGGFDERVGHLVRRVGATLVANDSRASARVSGASERLVAELAGPGHAGERHRQRQLRKQTARTCRTPASPARPRP